MIDYNKIDFNMIRMSDLGLKIARDMAKDLVNVKSMPESVVVKFIENAKPENHLIREGYEPVSRFKLLWTKK